LSISKSIIEAHQGKIHAEPSPLGGISICLFLPFNGGEGMSGEGMSGEGIREEN
jgi:signal transduction histidine kinase